jgi:hypothetical protein
MSKVAAFFGDLLFCAGNPMLAHMVFFGWAVHLVADQ